MSEHNSNPLTDGPEPVRRSKWVRDLICLLVMVVVPGVLLFVPPLFWMFLVSLFCVCDLLLYVGVPIVALILFVLLAARLSVPRWRYGTLGFMLRSAVVVPYVIGFVFIVSPLVIPIPGAISQTAGFWFRMKHHADVAAIRVWARDYAVSADTPETDDWISVPVQQLPPCVTSLGTDRVRLRRADHTVSLIYGGGFGHWGLDIGPKGMPPPEAFCQFRLEDGAYVWNRE